MQQSSLALGDTNSQFYIWEPANPREREDFEEDLIASTNENLYQVAPAYARQKGYEMERQTFF